MNPCVSSVDACRRQPKRGIAGSGPTRWPRTRRIGRCADFTRSELGVVTIETVRSRSSDADRVRPTVESRHPAAGHGAGSDPFGQSTQRRSGCFMRPACASASAPQPQKKSARTAPVIALPVSCAITARRSGTFDSGSVVSSQAIVAVRNAERVDRDRAAGRQRHGLRALRAELRIGQRLLAEEDIARVAPQQLVDALRIRWPPTAGSPATRPARASARPARPASARPSGTAGRCGRRRRPAPAAGCRRSR